MKKNLILILSFVLIAFAACNSDDESAGTQTLAAFVNPAINLTAAQTPVNVVFSAPTKSSGTVTLTAVSTNVVYGTDFTTAPAVANNKIVIPFEAGVSSATFTFNRIVEAFEGETKNVVFTISEVSVNGITIPEQTKAVQVNFDETALVENTVSPEVGGANVPNQVHVDLSSGAATAIQRTKWDLGFSSTAFRVAINGSINMAVKQLATSNIDVVVADAEKTGVAVGTGNQTGGVDNGNIAYVDGPAGDITTTAIAEVSATDADNKVYIVNLGYDLETAAPAPGSVDSNGPARGWKKIRVLRSGNDYKLQYANLDATTHQEVTITKNAAFNFTFFSLTSNAVVTAEPQKDKWDINFTTFTNHTNFGTGNVSYFFQDFIVTNTKGGARSYQVLNSAGVAYNDFALANVVEANFTNDQRNIGSNWRSGGGPTTLPSVRDDRFYVIKDPAGNIYKIKFTAMTNAAGERGNPTFQYQLLQ